jgi:cyclase
VITERSLDLAVRVIPCLDVKDGRVVKGTNFKDLADAGDPLALAKLYNEAGADEITFLDISASEEERATTLEIVKATAEQVFIPLTVGGGVRSSEDVNKALRSGADKVSVNTSAIKNPTLIDEIVRRFGSQVLVISIDARRNPQMASGFEVTTHGGKKGAGKDALDWAQEAQERGAGEILLNSIDADGTRAGYDTELISAVRSISSLPIIASGGAGSIEHFAPAIRSGANAVLAASIFHFQSLKISEVKDALRSEGFPVR